MATLDKSRDFATCFGISDDNAAYVQDGIRFQINGEEAIIPVEVDNAPVEEPAIEAVSEVEVDNAPKKAKKVKDDLSDIL